MPTCQELQQQFLQLQSEIGGLELKKLILFNKCAEVEKAYLAQKAIDEQVNAKLEEAKAQEAKAQENS